MVELTDLTRGDELAYELTTVYQSGDDPDPYTGVLSVAAVDVEEGEDGEVVAVNVYFDYKTEENDGYAMRRARLEDGELTYEQARGSPADPTWASFSRDDGFDLERADCGAETENGACGMTAGWGTNHPGRGKCKHHDTNESCPNVEVGEKVVARME